MTIYNLYMFDRTGECICYREWKRQRPSGMAPEQEHKLVYGMILSLRSLCTKLSPHDTNRQAFRSYQTRNYKMNYFETPTNLKIVLNSDLNAAGMQDLLQQVYARVYVEAISKNTSIRTGEDLTQCPLFLSKLDALITSHTCF